MCPRKSTILCIDADRPSLESLETLLERDGYDVLTATSGGHGLELLVSRQVDGVILGHNVEDWLCAEEEVEQTYRRSLRLPLAA
jgi:DNA-binding response OmpR family regulator